MNDNTNTSAPETIILQHDIVVRSTDDQQRLIDEETVASCPNGYTSTRSTIVGGFPVGSWWEHDKGIVVRLEYKKIV